MPGSNCRVFLGGLSNRASEGDVERFFKGFGRIRNITLKNGYGFVEFEDPRDADDAVYEMNNQSLCGSRVTVERSHGMQYFLIFKRFFVFTRLQNEGYCHHNVCLSSVWRLLSVNILFY